MPLSMDPTSHEWQRSPNQWAPRHDGEDWRYEDRCIHCGLTRITGDGLPLPDGVCPERPQPREAA